MDSAKGVALFVLQAMLMSPCLGITYYSPYRSGGVDYTQFDPYSDNVRVDSVTSIKFQTKGKNDAHILLQYDRSNYNSQVIEVVLGGWGNGKSVIRDRQQGSPKAQYRSAILSTSSYQWFWISWAGGNVQVGKGSTVGSSTIMSWNGLSHAINGVRVSYGYGSDGYFIFDQAVNGGWSNWGSWSSCTVTCGSGTQQRQRTCNNPAPSGGGATCSGSGSESQTCTPASCPINGVWGTWASWGTCTVTCAGGTQGRTRACNDPSAQHGGDDCAGNNDESQACNTANCPIDGVWNSWTSWGSCSVTCDGGTQGRTRSCDNPPAQYGGDECPGDDDDSRACSTDNCPIDGVWSTWTAWGTCSVTCAGGTQGRTRACDNPSAQYGGDECSGIDAESQDCNTLNCPIDGDWTDWGAWSSCGVTCSDTPVYITRERSCTNPEPQYNGADCAGNETDTMVCDIDPCPVDGVWGSWTAYGPCSVTCEGGVRNRTRSCDSPAPAWGGADCDDVSSETGVCNENGCDEIPPVDGNWGTWGSWQGCSVTCGTGVQRRYRDCDSPAPAYNGLPCLGDGFEENACSGGSTCPVVVDGNWGAWSTAVSCTATCGTGTTTRVRSCDSPSPSNGGIQCVGESIVVETCTVAAVCDAGNSSDSNGYGEAYVNVCPSGYFSCFSGYVTCVSEVFRCDCEDDCVDGSDESDVWAGCTAEQSVLCSAGNGIHRNGLVTGSVLLILVVKYLNSLYQ